MASGRAARTAPAEAKRDPNVEQIGGRPSANSTPDRNRLQSLRLSEVPIARLAYAICRNRPYLSMMEVSARLASDYGLRDNRRKPFRLKRLRRLITTYKSFVDAGVEPAPETIFGDEPDSEMVDDRALKPDGP